VNAAVTLAGILVLALNAYVLLGGADFGGGVWDLLARGPRAGRQRELVAHAIGPVWEANHVWLILAIVLLFTCFPAAFARLSIALHVPLAVMLVGIVVRGSAFTFRSSGAGDATFERRWGRAFAGASLLTPVLLGVTLGAIASGRVGERGEGSGTFVEGYVLPWLTPFGVAVGLLTLACFAFLAAVYLVHEADDHELREDFRHRAIRSGIAVLAAAVLALGFAGTGAPRLVEGLMRSAWAIPYLAATGFAAAVAFAGLWRRRYRLARVAAASEVSLLVWGWALAQYPYLVPPDLTVAGAAAPAVTLRLVLIGLGGGAVVLIPALYYLFRVFKQSALRTQVSE
jgi:cytochrome d ubiquinol oxidase subunit II